MAASAALAIMAMSSIGGAVGSAAAAKTQGEFARAQANENARLAELQAKETEEQGNEEASQYRRKVRGLIGSQRAALAAQGIDVSSGTAAEIQGETAFFGEQDASRIKENAFRRAFGYRRDAMGMRAQGHFDYLSGRNESRNTLLTGGMQAISYGLQGYDAYANKPKKS